MISPKPLHIKGSIEYNVAKAALEERDFAKYQKHLLLAFDYFKQASDIVAPQLEAEPTRSVLHRSAASIALQLKKYRIAEELITRALSGNPPVSLAQELRRLYKDYILDLNTIEQPEGHDVTYLMMLRHEAINLKLDPISLKYQKTPTINNIQTFISVIEKSWSNFLQINFVKELKNKIDNIDEVAVQLPSMFPLVAPNNMHSSFAISISCDTKVMTDEVGMSTDVINWKKDIFSQFKRELFENELEDELHLHYLENRYTPKERNAIFGNFIKKINNSKEYNVYITDYGFREIKKKIKPVKKNIGKRLLPSVAKVEDNSPIILINETYTITDQTHSKRKRETIEEIELKSAKFTLILKDIQNEGDALYLKEPLEAEYEFDNGSFTLQFVELGMVLYGKSKESLISDFQKRLIERYKQLRAKDSGSMNLSESQQIKWFNGIISLASL